MTALASIRILLVEDHETVRTGLRLLVDAQDDMEVIGEAANGRAGVERAAALRPDVVVMDVSMPDMNGLAAMRALRDSAPDVRVVTLTRHNDPAYVKELLASGASGYVLKQSASGELLRAIRAAAAGQQHLDSALAVKDEVSRLRRRGEPQQNARISDREAEVLRLTALGHSNKEIAQQLELSVKTVEVHKTNSMRKLSLRGRIDVVRYAVLQGWLHDT